MAGTMESSSKLLPRTEVSQEHRGIKQEGTESSRDRLNFYISDQKSD